MTSSGWLPALLALALAADGDRLDRHHGGGALAFSPDGRRLLSHGSEGIRLWDPLDGTERELEKGGSGPRVASERHAAFTPGGKEIVVFDAGQVITWSVETGARQRAVRGPSGFLACSVLSPDGSSFASVVAAPTGPWTVRIHAAARELETSLDIPEGEVDSMAFSPNGERLALAGYVPGRGGREAWVRVWRLDRPKEPATLRIPPPGSARSSLAKTPAGAFSPDGRLLVVARTGGTHIPGRAGGPSIVQLWDLETGSPRSELEGHRGQVWGAAFTPDGRRLATWGPDDLVVWDLASKKPTVTRPGTVHSAAFAPDGSAVALIASPDLIRHRERTVTLVDLVTGKDRFALPEAYYHDAAFSPDGKLLAVSSDQAIRLVDPATGDAPKPNR
jgi:WD40 repeat protein